MSGDEDAWVNIAVPDDLSELATDPASHRREVREARKTIRRNSRSYWRSDFEARLESRKWLLPFAMTMTAVVLSVLVVSLLTLLAPKIRTETKGPSPLAKTTVAAGRLDGLLPVADVYPESGRGVESLRSIRPAVILVLPTTCNLSCSTLVSDVATDAQAASLQVATITDQPKGSPLAAVETQISQLVNYDDPAGVIESTYGFDYGVIVVQGNGIVANIDPASQINIERDLPGQLQAGIAP